MAKKRINLDMFKKGKTSAMKEGSKHSLLMKDRYFLHTILRSADVMQKMHSGLVPLLYQQVAWKEAQKQAKSQYKRSGKVRVQERAIKIFENMRRRNSSPCRDLKRMRLSKEERERTYLLGTRLFPAHVLKAVKRVDRDIKPVLMRDQGCKLAHAKTRQQYKGKDRKVYQAKWKQKSEADPKIIMLMARKYCCSARQSEAYKHCGAYLGLGSSGGQTANELCGHSCLYCTEIETISVV